MNGPPSQATRWDRDSASTSRHQGRFLHRVCCDDVSEASSREVDWGLTCPTPLTTPAFQRGDVTMSLAVSFSVYQVSSPTDTCRSSTVSRAERCHFQGCYPSRGMVHPSNHRPQSPQGRNSGFASLISSCCLRAPETSRRGPQAEAGRGQKTGVSRGGWVNPSISRLRTLRLTHTERLR